MAGLMQFAKVYVLVLVIIWITFLVRIQVGYRMKILYQAFGDTASPHCQLVNELKHFYQR